MMKSFQFLTTCAALLVVATVPSCQSFSPPLNSDQTRRRRSGYAPHPQTLQFIGTTKPTTAALQASSKQLLEFQEPTTGVTVKLIGAMHYNPASIQLTIDTINELARQDKLGAVIIESCDIRWNKTQELPRTIQNLLQSEMKAACELAMDEQYQRPVVLGDQRINITVNSLQQGFKETIVDLATPWNGGWSRLLANVTAAKEEALPSGDNYLDVFAFFDPKLLLAAPVSLIKYPLSYLFRSPVPTIAFMTLLFLSEQPADAATVVTMDQMTAGDWIGSLVVSAAEIALFARIFLKELLVERNKLLARNILEQCKLYSSAKKPPTTAPWNIFGGGGATKDDSFEIVYVKGSEPRGIQKQSNDMAVVAVLGMAHCNGIAKLLKEQLV